MVTAVLVSLAAAVAMAWTVARRRPEYRAVALLLSLGLVTDVAQLAFDARVLSPLRASLGVDVPWTGWAHVAAVAEDALTLLWPASLVGAVLAVFTRKTPWIAAMGWALGLAFFVLVHPIAGDGSQARALTAVQVLSSVSCAGVIAAWYKKTPDQPEAEHLVLALMVAAELVSLMGSWTHGLFERWPVSQMLYLTLFCVLVLVQGRHVWTSAHASS